ncbi:MAG: hypothetical protein U5L04_12825 [Trueperaceae bacterium]|nr:hypothetical protein [Trueperaceae bacterium]
MNERQRTYQLRHIVERAKTLPFYAERLAHIDPTDVWADDLSALPTLRLGDLVQHFAAHPPSGGFLRDDIVQVQLPGTETGSDPDDPVRLPCYLTRNGQVWQAEATANYFAHCGFSDRDRCLLALGDHDALGSWLFYDGLVDIGATVVRSPALDAETLASIGRDHDVNVLIATRALAEQVGAVGGRFRSVVVVGNQPSLAPHTRERLETALGARVFDSYVLNEAGLVAGDTLEEGGMQVVGAAAVVEVLAPDGLEPTPEGGVGELVVTSLTREGIPILRLRTGDLALRGYQDEYLQVLPRGVVGRVDADHT